MNRVASHWTIAGLVAGMLALLAAPGHAQVTVTAPRIPDEDMVELARRSCHALIIGDYGILPGQVSFESARRVDLRVVVQGVVRQPAPAGPMAFECLVSAYQGTGQSFGQVFSLNYRPA
jgi:hypothetical protein